MKKLFFLLVALAFAFVTNVNAQYSASAENDGPTINSNSPKKLRVTDELLERKMTSHFNLSTEAVFAMNEGREIGDVFEWTALFEDAVTYPRMELYVHCKLNLRSGEMILGQKFTDPSKLPSLK